MLPVDWLEQLRAEAPARLGHHGWEKLRVLVPRLVFTWHIPWETILKGVRNYRLMNERMGKIGSEFVMPMAKLLDDRERLFMEYAEMDMRSPVEVAADRAKQALVLRAAKVGFRAQLPGEPDFRYEDAIKEAERGTQVGTPKFAVVR
jgi:hypothetical protein